jgi:hypothetical protein
MSPDRRAVSSNARLATILLGALLLCVPVFAEDPPDLSGTWAMIQFLPEIADLPFIGQVSITAVVGLLVHTEQEGTDLTFRDVYCRTEVLSDETILTSEVPDPVMASLDPAPRTARLEPTGGGWRLIQDPHIEIRGATFEDPWNEPLPRGPWDPRVIDSDSDGHPGFTVPVAAFSVVSGDTYVVQRLAFSITSDDVRADAFEGAIDWSSEQKVLGGTDVMLLMGFDQWHHPDPSRHRFVMRRLDDDATCDDVIRVLVEERDAYVEIFPEAEEETPDEI